MVSKTIFSSSIKPLSFASISFGAIHALQLTGIATSFSPISAGLTTGVYTLAHTGVSKIFNKMFQTNPSCKGYKNSVCYILIQISSAGSTILLTHYLGILTLATFTAYTSIELLIYLKTIDYFLVSGPFSRLIDNFLRKEPDKAMDPAFDIELNEPPPAASSDSLQSFSSSAALTSSSQTSAPAKSDVVYPWNGQKDLTFHFTGFPLKYLAADKSMRYFSHYDSEKNKAFYTRDVVSWAKGDINNDPGKCNSYGFPLSYVADGKTYCYEWYDRKTEKPIYSLEGDNSSSTLSRQETTSLPIEKLPIFKLFEKNFNDFFERTLAEKQQTLKKHISFNPKRTSETIEDIDSLMKSAYNSILKKGIEELRKSSSSDLYNKQLSILALAEEELTTAADKFLSQIISTFQNPSYPSFTSFSASVSSTSSFSSQSEASSAVSSSSSSVLSQPSPITAQSFATPSPTSFQSNCILSPSFSYHANPTGTFLPLATMPDNTIVEALHSLTLSSSDGPETSQTTMITVKS